MAAAPVPVFVLSITRDLADPVGGELAERVAAGAVLAGRDLVAPDTDAVDQAVAKALANPKVRCLLVAGSVALGDDAGSTAVTRKLIRPIPAFAERARAVAFAAGRAGALLDAPVGGYVKGKKLAFAFSAAEAVSLVEELLLPCLGALLEVADAVPLESAPAVAAMAGKEAASEVNEEPAVEQAPEPVTQGVSVVPIVTPAPVEEKEALATGWEAGLRAIHGEFNKGWPDLPEALDRMAAARSVLDSAGQRGVVVLEDGRRYGAFGFPDLQRVGAKVLVVRDGEPVPEIIALHRHPSQVGTCVSEGGVLPSSDLEAGSVAEGLVGAPPPGGGDLFALEGDAVYLKRGGRVVRWDGRKEKEEGTVSQALASLMLGWTQR